MAEFKLGRIRFVWKGEWTTGATYYKDDVVRNGGKTFICTIGHVADADFYTDLDNVPTRWNQMTDGQNWRGDWTTARFYNIGDLVKYGGTVYIANDSHTSAATTALGLEANSSDWDTFAEGFDWKGVWATNTRYKLNDIVKYGGITYLCNTGHLSAATVADGLEANQASWDVWNAGVDYKGDWSGSAVRYKVNDVVKNGAGLYIAIDDHTSTAVFSDDEANWNQLVEGIEFGNDWSNVTYYQPGDVVRYGGNQYIAKTNHINSNPVTGVLNWDLFSEGFRYQNDWSISTSYKIGEVVRVSGYTYLAIADSPSFSLTATATSSVNNRITVDSTTGIVAGMAVNFTGTTFGGVATDTTYYVDTIPSITELTIKDSLAGSTKVLTTATGTMTVVNAPPTTNTSYWARLNSGIRWQGEWQDDFEYVLGDSVRYGSNAYICVQTHRSEGDDGSTIGTEGGGAANSRPDQDISGTYWNVLNIGSEVSVLTTRGDLVYYSGSGPARLPVGGEGETLRVSTDLLPEWARLGYADHVYYVALHGTDLPAPTHGLTVDKPWRTIRYACEQVEQGPRNPQAARLLELNRQFIQREIVEWIDYQIANVILPFSGSFVYEDTKCERDMGYLIDAFIHDIKHGGNAETVEAALSYINDTVGSPYLTQKDETVAAINYGLTVITKVLDQEAPAVNYQVTNGDNSTAVVLQYFDADLTAEAGVDATIQSLGGVVTNAITDGVAANVPSRYLANNLIQIKTGVFQEILPIIVPENTCVIGDEVRSTTAGPISGVTSLFDAKYSMETLTRLESVIGDVVKGTAVTPTTGNVEPQSSLFPFADTPEETTVEQLIRTIQHNIDFRLGTTLMSRLTDPTNYNGSYLNGYGDARKLIIENKEYFKVEVIEYITLNYPDTKYSRTTCKRDVGYIVDAVIYDLTFGGTKQSLNAGLAYYDGPAGALMFDSSELTATLAAMAYLKSMMTGAANNTVVGGNQVAIAQYRDTAGSAASITHIGNCLDIIIAIVQNGTDSAPSVSFDTINSNTITTTANHNLQVGDRFGPVTGTSITTYGFTAGTVYWVKSVPAGNQLTLASTYDASTLVLTNGTGLGYTAEVVDNPALTWGIAAGILTEFTNLSSSVETIVTNMTAYLAANFPSLTYDIDKCERDVRIILDAVGFDFAFDSNYNSLKAAYAYLRSSASEVYSLGQKTATRAALTYVKEQAELVVSGSATVVSRVDTLMTLVDDIIFSGSGEGLVVQSPYRNAHHAVRQLELNRDFIKAETTAYIADTFSDSVTATAAGTNRITISDTSWLQRNTAIRFTGTVAGGVLSGVTYYVSSIVNSTTFTISETRYGIDFTLSNSVGGFNVVLHYDNTKCLRDVDRYIDALKWDVAYHSNYKSLLSSRYYANAIRGSLEEDMYYLRNGTGVRNQTLDGLTGDLLAENAYGTSRVSAGAYCSLDPGWGPADKRVWITQRSPYVQNVTTFGYAAVGQKIDGALHDGGNDSIVSNDFTQVISDGIGAWITNNGRAELVSVFTYYSHIGYLAENGGRIRGTNGNNSYGDFGSVAEGFDDRETPNTGIVDNRFQFNATVGSVFTDNVDEILAFQFENAGTNYREVEWNITGAGIGAVALQDEFRDDAVFQVRLLNLNNDSSGQFGGDGYLTNSNTSQGGTTTQITIAATDSELSTSYVGMKVYLTGGTGVGQYGIIGTYNAGTKVATVVKENGSAGWDHVVPGRTIASPDASTTYTIEPRINFDGPGFTSSIANDMPSSGVWTDAIYGDTTASYINLTGTYSGSGANARWNVAREGSKYTVTIANAGTGYSRLETIVIAGTDLGGLSTDNDLTITITSVNSTTGAILEFDQDGYGCGGVFVAVRSGSTAGAYSNNGTSWSAATLPSGANWSAVAHGLLEDGSSALPVSRFVAISSGGTAAAYSDNGITWTAANLALPASATWVDVYYGNGRFVAVASDSTTLAISIDGIEWDLTGTLPSTGYTSITYGNGKWVAVRSGTNNAAYSTDNAQTWSTSGSNLPATSAWISVRYGNGRFVAIASDSNSGAYSLTGNSDWTAMTIGSADGSTTGGYQKMRYGQGLFMATAYLAGVEDFSFVATSQEGLDWTVQGVDADPNAFSGWNAVAFGNPHQVGRWAVIGKDSGNNFASIRTGAKARGRAFVSQTKLFAVYLSEPGSGYDTAPNMTIVDPNNTFEAPFEVRVGKGALGNPTFTNRGAGYIAAGAEVDTGDGYGDFYQTGSFVAVRRLTERPVAGSNVVFGHLPDRTFKLVNVLTFRGTNDGAYTCFFQISPSLEVFEAPEHEVSITTRIRYSQVRLTGHDFLDIGTGNFTETNYPNVPTQDPNQANETVEGNGGRVFFTSTDQDGNFRVGDLFTVEQSTGIATLNADAFNIAGLQELSLGEVTLGGASATITEFSTDPFFTADSDNIVPTQRAIKAYISAQIGGGGASLNVNSVTAGFIFIGTNVITTTTGAPIQMRGTFDFRGGVTGVPLAFNYFLT